MIDPGTSPSPQDDALGHVVESFLDRFRRGERPALTELVHRHPGLADQLRELIPALLALEQMGDATGSFSGHDAAPPVTEGPLTERLGDYRILRRIGGGGMGVVYEAEHESLKSRVALKVMHPRFRADRRYLRRFHIEARSAAGLHHTNIVSVFDYGEQDGVCYYAMQFIAGQPLDRVLADLRRLRAPGGHQGGLEGEAVTTLHSVAEGLLTGRFVSPIVPSVATERTESRDRSPSREPGPAAAEEIADERSSLGSGSLGGAAESRYYREVARVCAQIAEALEYAHRRGILHRDIKPPNLLLDALGNVWVTDFGLAKLEEVDDPTQSQELIGTLRYMAPERFRGISDRPGDTYALGATLYEMLTLQPAFDGTDQLRLIDRIVNDRPKAPRLIDGRIPRDLETIVLRALAKDPKDRFGSAGAMAEELRRFIAGRPIHSRPVSVPERLWRWCKRDPWLAGASVSAAVLTAVLAIGSMSAAYVYRHPVSQLKREKQRTMDASLDARRRAVDAYIAQAGAGRFSRRPGQRFSSLKAIGEASRLLDDLALEEPVAERRDMLRDLAIAALALPDIRVAKTLGRNIGERSLIDIDPAFERYVVSDHAGNSTMVRVADGVEIASFPNAGKPVRGWARFGPKGRLLAQQYDDGRWKLWRVDGRPPVLVFAENRSASGLRSLDFRHDDSAVLISTLDDRIVVIDGQSGERRVLPPQQGHVTYASFHPDGRSLVAVVEDAGKWSAKVRELDDPRPRASLDLSTTIHDVAWSPDGRRIALAGDDGRILVWEPGRSGAEPAVLSGLNNMGVQISFNHRGDLLASQGWEGVLRLWNPSTGRQLLSKQTDAIPRFSADDRYLGPGRSRGSLQIFEVSAGSEVRVLPGDASPDRLPQDLSFGPDGRTLTARMKRGLQIWDTLGVRVLANLEGLGWSAALFEADGTLLTFGSTGVLRWPVRREGLKLIVGPPRVVRILTSEGGNFDSSRDGGVLGLAIPRRAAIVLTGGPFGKARGLTPQNDVRSVAISPDGRWAATVSHEGVEEGVFVWDVATARRVAILKAPLGSMLRFSPNGRWLATSSGECKLWEVGTWKLAREFDIDSRSVAFSPDTSVLAICTKSQVELYDPATGGRLATFENPGLGTVSYPAFSADGGRLAMTDEQSHSILIWDLRLIRAELESMSLNWSASDAKAGGPETLVPPASPPPPIHIEVIGGGNDDLARIRSRFAAWTELDRMRRLVAPRLDSPEEYHERSHQWAALGKWDAALADAERACQERTDNAHWIATMGIYAFQAGDDAKALVAMKKAVAMDPDDAQTAATLAWALLVTAEKDRDPARALALADKLLLADPGNREYGNTRALALSRLGRDADAVAAAGPSASLSPFAQLVVAPCYHRLGQHQIARESLDRALVWRSSAGSLTPRQVRDLDSLIAECKVALARSTSDPSRR